MYRTLDNNALGELLLYLREDAGLTQRELAKEINTSYTTISKWEHGTAVPDINMFYSIANYFKLTLDELFCSAETLRTLQNKAVPCNENQPSKSVPSKNRKKYKIGGLIAIFIVCIGICFSIGYFLGVQSIKPPAFDPEALDMKLLTEEYRVDLMYGYTCDRDYLIPKEMDTDILENYARIIVEDILQEKDNAKHLQHITISFSLENSDVPYFMFGYLHND